jgi:hypothetical protein
MCKNLKYISLLQSRAMLAEPSKMHKNRPLVVYPAKIVVIETLLLLPSIPGPEAGARDSDYFAIQLFFKEQSCPYKLR